MALQYFRAFERRTLSFPAVLNSGEQGSQAVRLLNLGIGGACVELSERLALGTQTTCELELPNRWEPLAIAATVAWVQRGAVGFVAGLAFDHTSPLTANALLGLLATEAYS